MTKYKLHYLFKDDNTQGELKEGIKYILAQDYRYEEKTLKCYHDFESIEEMKKFIKNNENLYELSYNKKRKLYLDLIDHEVEMTRDEFMIYIDKLIGILNKELNINTTREDYNIFVNGVNKISSSHVISKVNSMNFLEQKELIRHLIKEYDDIYVDDAVYKNNQLFRLLGNSKLGKEEYLQKLNENERISLKSSLINETEDLTELYYMSPESEVNKPKRDIYIRDIIKETKDDLNKSFFISSSDWKQATRIIKKMQLYSLEGWNKLSIEKTQNSRYTIEKNEEFMNDINIDEVKSGIEILVKILNRHLEYDIIIFRSPITDYFLHFMETNYGIEKKDLDNILFEEFSKRSKRQRFTKPYKYKNLFINFGTGAIQNDKDEIKNFRYDDQKINHEGYDKYITTIEGVKEDINNFIENDKTNLYLCSSWGTGKTNYTIREVIEYFRENILLITESNTLNGKLKTDFEKYGFKSHLDRQKNRKLNLNRCKNVICSIQSIKHVEGFNSKIIIIDETESVFNAFLSKKTFQGELNSSECFDMLKKKMGESERNLFLDADLSVDRIEILDKMIKNKEKNSIKNNDNKFRDYSITIYNHKTNGKYFEEMKRNINDNKKIIFPSCSNQIIKTTYLMIRDEHPNKNILLINQNGISMRTKTQNFENKLITLENKNFKIEFLNNLENEIIKNDIDVFLFSPTIKTGVSINCEYFNICFGYATDKSINAYEFMQQLFRARRLKDKTINIFCNVNKPYLRRKNYKQILPHLKKNQQLIKNINDYYDFEIKDIEGNDDFKTMQALNYSNAYNSKEAFTQELLYILQKHEMKYRYIKEKDFKEIEDLFKEKKEELKNIDLEKIVQCRLINYEENKTLYEKIKKDEEILTEQEKMEFEKFNIFYQVFNLRNIINSYEKGKLERNKDFNNKEFLDENSINNDIRRSIDKRELIQNQNKILEIIDYDRNNNKDFYRKYDDYGLNRLKFMRGIFEEYVGEDGCNFDGDKKAFYYYVINETIRVFGYKTCNGKKIITNRDFRNVLERNEGYLKKTIPIYYLEGIKNDNKTSKLVKGINMEKYKDYKEEIKKVYLIVKEILGMVDIGMKYVDIKHTNREYDKIIMYNKMNYMKFNRKVDYKNRSLLGLEEYINKGRKKKDSKYRLKKEELKYLDTFKNYHENIEEKYVNQRNKKYYLFNKIEIYKIDNIYKFYKPILSKGIEKLRNRKCVVLREDMRKVINSIM